MRSPIGWLGPLLVLALASVALPAEQEEEPLEAEVTRLRSAAFHSSSSEASACCV